MKIALIDPSLFTWPYDLELARGLSQNGNEVAVFGKHLAKGEPGGGSPQLRELFYPGFQARWMHRLPHPVFLALKGLAHPVSLTDLLRELRNFQPDVIHFQWTPLPAIDRLFIPAFRRIAPTILTVHDSTPFNANPRSRLQGVGAISVMHLFDRLIVHTEQARQRLLAYGIAADRVARIPHGILEASTAAPVPLANAQEKPFMTLLLFGKLKPYKGADILIRALAAMPDAARARCRLRIVGKSYMDTESLVSLAKELGVKDNIIWDLRFVGDAEMPGIFAEADVMVMPYREIDASGVLMAALAAGRPIVASRIGLFAEMLEDGAHGYLVPPEDPATLSSALTKLVDNNDARLAMGNRVRALHASIPGWQEIAAMTETLYAQAIGSRMQAAA